MHIALKVDIVELSNSASSIVKEHKIVVLLCKGTRFIPVGNDVCPAFGKGGAGQEVDATLPVGPVELSVSALGVIEEEHRVATISNNTNEDNMSPTGGIHGAGD